MKIKAGSDWRVYPHRLVDESKLGGSGAPGLVQYQNAAGARSQAS